MQTITADKLHLGFCGLGWIGRSRLNAILEHNLADKFTIADPSKEVQNELKQSLNGAGCFNSINELLNADLDGVVIASPSALHADQCMQALEHGKAVFCQKPLGRNTAETQKVVALAEEKNLLLHVDFSYRFTKGIQAIKNIIDNDGIGKIYGINLTFHNAYGPDKDWYKNPKYSGGGCFMDLGIHLVDLLFWLFDDPVLTHQSAQFFHQGTADFDRNKVVEDYAVAQCIMNNETAVQLACSWFLPAGKDAIIEAAFYGEKGGLSFKNINGSFYDFKAEQFFGTRSETLTEPPENWQGKAAVHWANQLTKGKGFDSEAWNYVKVARELENFYKANVL